MKNRKAIKAKEKVFSKNYIEPHRSKIGSELCPLVFCCILCCVLCGCAYGKSADPSAPTIIDPGAAALEHTDNTPASSPENTPVNPLANSHENLPEPPGNLSSTTTNFTDEGSEEAQPAENYNENLTEDPSKNPGEVISGPTPESAPPSELTLLMVGDILLHTPVEQSALREDGSYNYDAIFAHTKDTIAAADLALVNQEVILGGKELGVSGYPAFNAPFEVGDTLVNTGFDVICHGTNHAMDKGKKGLLNCIGYWRENHPGTAVLGIHDSPESQDSLYLYKENDICVAILNYTYGTNGITLPEGMPYAVDLLDKDRVVSDIRRAREAADFVIVCPHWGTEYRLTPDSMQAKWTEIFLENGVDLVLGTHPHVIEPVEWITNGTTGRRMLVYYSLGNFVNWTSGIGDGVANRMVGGMAKVTLSRGEDDNVIISECGIEALVCHVSEGTDGVTVYPLSEYPEELAAQNAIIDQDRHFSRDYCVNLCDQVWGELWE